MIRRYDYIHVPTVARFAQSNAMLRHLMGPFGSGKSVGCWMEILRRAKKQKKGPDGIRRSRWVVVRNSFPQLKDTTIKTVLDWTPELFCGTYKVADHNYIIDRFDPEVHLEVLFRALDRPDHIKNLLSLEVTGAWFNELREIPKAIYQGMQGRIGRYPAKLDGGCSWFGIISDTNPPDVDHWLYNMFEDDGGDSEKSTSGFDEFGLDSDSKNITITCFNEECGHQFNLAEHPACPNCGLRFKEIFKQPSGRSSKAENISNLPQNYYQTLMVDKGSEFIKVYVDGEYGYVMDGRPVHPDFKQDIHIAKTPIKPIPATPIIVSFDFGLTPACVIMQHSSRGRLAILKEFVTENMSIRQLVREIVKPDLIKNYSRFRIIATGDPAGRQRMQTDERTCIMEVESAGIKPFTPAITNAHLPRKIALDSFLRKLVDGYAGLLIDPSCKTLIKGLNGKYCYRRMQVVGDERYTNEPEKNIYSHICEAAQYGAMMIEKEVERSESATRANIAKRKTPPPYESYG